MLSCDVIIWDDNTPLFYFSLKLHSLAYGLVLNYKSQANTGLTKKVLEAQTKAACKCNYLALVVYQVM